MLYIDIWLCNNGAVLVAPLSNGNFKITTRPLASRLMPPRAVLVVMVPAVLARLPLTLRLKAKALILLART
jgi:hypothetical protein